MDNPEINANTHGKIYIAKGEHWINDVEKSSLPSG